MKRAEHIYPKAQHCFYSTISTSHEMLAWWWTGILVAAISRLLAVSILFFAVSAYAGQDQHEDGSFTRKDGAVVTIIKHEGSSFGPPSYFYTFQLADGQLIRRDYEEFKTSARAGVYDFILINHGSMVEIYGYRGTGLLPIARLVQRFDGHAFVDVTTPAKRWLSPLVHLREHIVGYALAIAILLIPLRSWITSYKATPSGSSGYFWVVQKIMWGLSGLAIIGIYSFLMMAFFSLPPVLILLGALLSILIYRKIRNLMRKT